MKTKNEILKWLRANLGKRCTAPLTSSDVYALVTSVNLCNLISYECAPRKLFEAYHSIVTEMQTHTRHLAYHAIACELDRSHREMIWHCAGLTKDFNTRCEFEPRTNYEPPSIPDDGVSSAFTTHFHR